MKKGGAAVPQVRVKFETKASTKFFLHKGKNVTLDGSGNGRFNVVADQDDLVLFGIGGAPGTTAKITLSVDPPATLSISGHPIEGKIAQARTVWGDNRFFKVKGGK